MSKFMNQKRSIALLFALVYPTLGVVTFSARAQEEPTSEAQPEINVVKEDSPKPFEQFEMKDPQTGEPIAADKVLTLPDGREVNAGEFYTELNRTEQDLNQLGYSLRDKVAERTIQESVSRDQTRFAPQLEKLQAAHQQLDAQTVNQLHQQFDRTVIQQEALQHEQLEQQFVQARDAVKPGKLNPRLDPRQIPKLNLKQLQNEEKLRTIDSSGTVLKFPVGDRFDVTKKAYSYEEILKAIPWDTQSRDQAKPANYYGERSLWFGDRSRFYAALKGRIDINGSGHTIQSNAEAGLEAYVFNARADLLRATANVQAPDNGDLSARINVSAFGGSVYDRQFKGATFQKSDTFSYSIGRDLVSQRFMLGPIPMNVTFGVRGSAGLRYDLYAAPRYAKASAVPFLNAQVYGQGGADIVIGGGGVGVNLTLLNNELELTARAKIRTDLQAQKIFLDANFYAYNKLDALGGNVYVYAFTYVPAFGIPPWEKKQWNWNVWDWKGFHHEGYLFNVNESVALL
jgi:hypothetical protein